MINFVGNLQITSQLIWGCEVGSSPFNADVIGDGVGFRYVVGWAGWDVDDDIFSWVESWHNWVVFALMQSFKASHGLFTIAYILTIGALQPSNYTTISNQFFELHLEIYHPFPYLYLDKLVFEFRCRYKWYIPFPVIELIPPGAGLAMLNSNLGS